MNDWHLNVSIGPDASQVVRIWQSIRVAVWKQYSLTGVWADSIVKSEFTGVSPFRGHTDIDRSTVRGQGRISLKLMQFNTHFCDILEQLYFIPGRCRIAYTSAFYTVGGVWMPRCAWLSSVEEVGQQHADSPWHVALATGPTTSRL